MNNNGRVHADDEALHWDELRGRAPRRLRFDILEKVGIVDQYAVAEFEPLGMVYVAASDRGISRVDVSTDAQSFEESFRARIGRPVRPGNVPRVALRALEAGKTTGFDVDLRSVSDFERSALMLIRSIPRGEVRSYSWVAEQIGHQLAVRAVGTAMARNPVPLLVPCHRVVRRDGRIGEYGLGGPQVKRTLLRHEGLEPDDLERLAVRGIRLLGSDSTGIVCLPSCHNARRIAAGHRLEFRSADEAQALGMRPCRHCLPFAAAVGTTGA